MEFKKIGINFIEKIQSFKSKAAKCGAGDLKEEESAQKSPNNPEYWQKLSIKKADSSDNSSDRVKNKRPSNKLLLKEQYQMLDDENKKIAEYLLRENYITENSLISFFDIFSDCKINHSAYIKSILQILNDSTKKENDTTCAFFNELCKRRPETFSLAHSESFKELLQENNPIKRRLVEIGRDNIDDGYIFFEVPTLNTLASYADENNIEDFASYVAENRSDKPELTREIMRDIAAYANPVTKKFDKRLADAEKSFKEANKDNKKTPPILNLRKAMPYLADEETNSISSEGIKFINECVYNGKTKQIRYYSSNYLKEILKTAKDAKGNINAHNINCIKSVLNLNNTSCFFDFSDMKSINLMKDDKGLIDENKLKSAIDKSRFFVHGSQLATYAEGMNLIGEEKASQFYDTLHTLFKYNSHTTDSVFIPLIKRCFDKEGKIIQKEFDKINEVGACFSGTSIDDKILNFISYKENREVVKSIFTDEYSPTTSDINELLKLADKYSDENGVVSPFLREKLKENINKYLRLPRFAINFEECMPKDKNEADFDEKKFKLLNTFYEKYEKINPSSYGDKNYFLNLLSGRISTKDLAFETKVKMLNTLNEISAENNFVENALFKQFSEKLNNEISLDKPVMTSDDKDIKTFTRDILGYSKVKKGELSPFEKIMADSIPLLKSLNGGLPLSYNRKDFLKDLSFVLNTQEKREAFSNSTKIKLTEDETTGNIAYYDGIINIENLDKNSEEYKLCHKFFYENNVQTGNKDFDEAMNKIIKAVPEFINTIGKKQHGTHRYTLDIHQLLVLAQSINNPDYKKLNNSDKIILKSAAIIHDIMKKEDTIDRGHQYPSADMAKQIANKFFKNEETKDRFYEFIRNHHWLELYSNNYDKEDAAKVAAFDFRRIGDFDIAKIMARADLMAVNDDFYNMLKNALDKKNISKIDDALVEMYSTGNIICYDYPVFAKNSSNNCESINGKTYKVINFNNIGDKEDLKKYGFKSGKTKKDIFMLVHMVDEWQLQSNLNTVKKLINSQEQGVLSESLITPNKINTFLDRKYGFLLSQINTNIVCADKWNQGSGYKKGKNEAASLMFDNFKREIALTQILENLGIEKSSLTKNELAEFYKTIARNTSLEQFPNSKTYSIGNKKVNGRQLKKAIIKYQQYLTDESNKVNNEIVAYAPKIKALVAKEKSLKDVPQEMLDFADKNNLPIILI